MKQVIKLISIYVTALAFTSCASNPTPYVPKVKEFGYTLQEVDERVSFSSFDGNSSTPQQRAKDFSKMAAIQQCLKQGQLTIIADTINNTKIETRYYTQVRTNTDEKYQTSSTVVNIEPIITTYPRYITTFRCVEKISSFEDVVMSEDIKATQLLNRVQDSMGGILVKKATERGAFRSGDLITRVNGLRVEKMTEVFENFLVQPNPPAKVKVVYLSETKPKTVEVPLLDLSAVLLAKNFETVKGACMHKRGDEPEIEICKLSLEEWMAKVIQ